MNSWKCRYDRRGRCRYDEISESIISDCNANGLEKLDSGEYHVLAPIHVPMQDVICLGVNYKEHIEETTDVIDFSKKKDAFRILPEEADEYILGYTIINDVSARNVQLKHQQWYLGKSLDGYTPMGPCIVTADEIGDPQSLKIKCFENDEKRQKTIVLH